MLDLGPPKLFILVVISQDYLALSANSIILSRYFTLSILRLPLDEPNWFDDKFDWFLSFYYLFFKSGF